LNIQIFGIKKSSNTRKAERFFSERRIPYHFRDLNEKGISKGELENITQSVPLEELIDTEGSEFKERNLSYMIYNIEVELLNDPLLLKMPVVRNGKLATAGYQPEVWTEWLRNEKS
jgi:arsenate reductase-like glutaredoxin family protein